MSEQPTLTDSAQDAKIEELREAILFDDFRMKMYMKFADEFKKTIDATKESLRLAEQEKERYYQKRESDMKQLTAILTERHHQKKQIPA